MKIEVWATHKEEGWTVGLTNHTERFVTLVRKGLSDEEATRYKNQLVLLAMDHAAEGDDE